MQQNFVIKGLVSVMRVHKRAVFLAVAVLPCISLLVPLRGEVLLAIDYFISKNGE